MFFTVFQMFRDSLKKSFSPKHWVISESKYVNHFEMQFCIDELVEILYENVEMRC